MIEKHAESQGSRRTCRRIRALVLGALVLLAADGARAHRCTGDCNGDDSITANELVQGVRIAGNLVPLFMCPQFDADVDFRVSDSELQVAVNNLFSYCGHLGPATPTNSPPATATPTPIEPPSPSVSPTPEPTEEKLTPTAIELEIPVT